MSDSEETAPEDPLSPEGLKRALKAFKKRLKLTRLDDESRLGYGPMSKGSSRNTGIIGIAPPNQFPQIVWDELARQGKLKHIGHGLYELTSG
jgi:hypothetical protein